MRTRAPGFTLLEVLIALTILCGGIILLGNSWSGNLMRIRKSNRYNNVAALLERKIVELETEYRGHAMTEIPETRSGDFGNDANLSSYRWAMKTRDLKFPDLSALIIGRDGGADETLITMIKQMTDVLSKSIKEIKVSIFVKTPKKELEFSATDYMIDYATGLASLPGAGMPGTAAPPNNAPGTPAAAPEGVQ
jgi:general secretion pathway protein I